MTTTRRPRLAVGMTFVGAALCTAYSADMAWQFAGERLGMTDVFERSVMFAVAEYAMLALANLARHNLRASGRPGPAGSLVWLVTLVQTIPAFVLSDTILTASVRAFFGPVLAALLWHLAMGLELKHATGEGSKGLLASLGRELSQRLLSRLGVAERDRDAAQITRDRATVKAAKLAADLADVKPGSRRYGKVSRKLADAVSRAEVAVRPEQKERLLAMLTARRNAGQLATVTLDNPWVTVAGQADTIVDADTAWDEALADLTDPDTTDSDTADTADDRQEDLVRKAPSRGRSKKDIQTVVDYLNATGQAVTGANYAAHLGNISDRTGRRDLEKIGIAG